MMVQKIRDIEILCKNTDYKSLYNECDLDTHDYFKLGLELFGKYKVHGEVWQPCLMEKKNGNDSETEVESKSAEEENQ